MSDPTAAFNQLTYHRVLEKMRENTGTEVSSRGNRDSVQSCSDYSQLGHGGNVGQRDKGIALWVTLGRRNHCNVRSLGWSKQMNVY